MGFFNKRGVPKNVRYYLSEIIVVVVGIFIAVQLNNLNENRKSRNEEQKSLKRISSDLQTEKLLLEMYIFDIEKSSEFLKDVIYNKKDNNLDSLYIHASRVFFHYKYNSEYVNLKYSGKLNLISNDNLRFELVRYYEAGHIFYQEISESHKKFSEDYIEKYFFEEFPIDTNNIVKPEIAKIKLKENKFINLLNRQINQYNFINQNVRIGELENLLKSIEKEIK